MDPRPPSPDEGRGDYPIEEILPGAPGDWDESMVYQHSTLPPLSMAPPLPQLSPSMAPYRLYTMPPQPRPPLPGGPMGISQAGLKADMPPNFMAMGQNRPRSPIRGPVLPMQAPPPQPKAAVPKEKLVLAPPDMSTAADPAAGLVGSIPDAKPMPQPIPIKEEVPSRKMPPPLAAAPPLPSSLTPPPAPVPRPMPTAIPTPPAPRAALDVSPPGVPAGHLPIPASVMPLLTQKKRQRRPMPGQDMGIGGAIRRSSSPVPSSGSSPPERLSPPPASPPAPRRNIKIPELKGPLIEDPVECLNRAAAMEAAKQEEMMARLQKFRFGSRALPSMVGVFGLTGDDYQSDRKEIGKVATRKPAARDRDDTDGEDRGDDRAAPLDTMVIARGSRKPPGRRPAVPLGASYPFKPAAPADATQPPELDLPDDSESEEEDEEILPTPVPVDFIVAEAERQMLDSQYRSLRDTAVRTAQDAEIDYKRNGYTLKCLQSLCWKEAQLLSVRKRKIRMLQDAILALRHRRGVRDAIKASTAELRNKIEQQKEALGLMSSDDVVEVEDEDENDLSDEYEDDVSPEDEDKPVNFVPVEGRGESLERGELVMTLDGQEGLVEGVRRGMVVMRRPDGVDSVPVEDVRRCMPPYKPRRPGRGDRQMAEDLIEAWAAIEAKVAKTEREAEMGLRDALESHYQEAGMEALLAQGDGSVEGDGDRGYGKSRSRRAAFDGPPPRPLYYSTAPRGIVPSDVPLFVTPVSELPDYVVAACYIGPQDAKCKESRQDRAHKMQDSAASEELREWERDRLDLYGLRAEVQQLETKVRMQKQRTDEVNRWMNDGGGPIHKLETQLESMANDIETLRYRHRLELTIAGVPQSAASNLEPTEGANISPPDLRLLSEAELGAVKGALAEEEEEEDKEEKRRRLKQEELEEEAAAAAEVEAAAAAEPPAPPLSFRGSRGRGGSFTFDEEDVSRSASIDRGKRKEGGKQLTPGRLGSLRQAVEMEKFGGKARDRYAEQRRDSSGSSVTSGQSSGSEQEDDEDDEDEGDGHDDAMEEDEEEEEEEEDEIAGMLLNTVRTSSIGVAELSPTKAGSAASSSPDDEEGARGGGKGKAKRTRDEGAEALEGAQKMRKRSGSEGNGHAMGGGFEKAASSSTSSKTSSAGAGGKARPGRRSPLGLEQTHEAQGGRESDDASVASQSSSAARSQSGRSLSGDSGRLAAASAIESLMEAAASRAPVAPSASSKRKRK